MSGINNADKFIYKLVSTNDEHDDYELIKEDVEQLLKEQNKLNELCTPFGETIAHILAAQGKLKSLKGVVMACKAHGQKLNLKNPDHAQGLNPLHNACFAYACTPDMLSYLIEEGKYTTEDLNARSKVGFTAAHIAAGCNGMSDALLNILQEKNADLSIKTNAGKTAKDIQREKKEHNLLAGYATNFFGQNSLHVSAFSHDNEITEDVDKLITRKDFFGREPIFYWTRRNDSKLLDKLLSSLSPEVITNVVQQTDSDKQTPLHFAALYCNEEVIKCLLNRGANPDSQSKQCITPREIAIRYGRENLFESTAEKALQHDTKALLPSYNSQRIQSAAASPTHEISKESARKRERSASLSS